MKKRLTSSNLDLALKYLRDEKRGQYLNPVKELQKIKEFQNFSNDELNLVAELLKNDSLVTSLPGKGVNKFRIKLNAGGLSFLESGGYRRKILNQHLNIALKSLSAAGIIVGMIIGGWQLFKSPLKERVDNLEKRIELLEK